MRASDQPVSLSVVIAAYDGRVMPVRFEITSPAPYARHFTFAAEARR